ncbi:MAG: hypothetical protein L6Q81_15155 [Bacteroidia bacterium]|nr:hypothetical protein [Bacteroidia bacterium]
MGERPSIIRICVTAVFFLVSMGLFAQGAPGIAEITFSGTIYDINDSLATPAPIVVNKRTGTGHAFLPGGNFSINGMKTDTFLVTSGGYNHVKFCFADSVYRAEYRVRVGLSMRVNELNPVTVFPVKDLKVIRQDRQNLGVQPTRTTEGVTDAVSSPITFLYERFSREGQSKALVAELENRDRTNAVLKDLFRTYNRAGVINLPENDFDAFIAFLNMPEAYLKNASDYELAVTIKQRFEQFIYMRSMHNRNQH